MVEYSKNWFLILEADHMCSIVVFLPLPKIKGPLCMSLDELSDVLSFPRSITCRLESNKTPLFELVGL